MTLRQNALLAGCIASLLLACGEDSSEEPIPTAPLKGTIDGREFVPVTALVKDGFDAGEKSVEITDSARGCDDFSVPAKGSRSILFFRQWTPGAAPLSFQNSVTFVIQEEDSPNNIIATTGRLELVETPTGAGATGVIRLRAIAGNDRVEGQMSVKLCE
jgi:hypothetical protein